MSSLVTRDATVTRTNIALAPAARTVGAAIMIANGLVLPAVPNPSRSSKFIPKSRAYHDREGSLVCPD
jgi:hypothetical protein